jgi:hypothetical protein
MAIKLQIRRGLAADWANPSNNPVLLAGEIGLETDTGNFKIGDGTLAWNSLPYARAAYAQISGAGNDLNAAAYVQQGRFEIAASVVTNVPSGWTPASDAPGILLVTRIATGSVAQVLFSTKTQRVFSRGWDGTAYTTWVALSQHDGSIGTSQLADDAVTADKLRDDAVTDGNRAVTTDHIRDVAVTTAKIADDAVTAGKLRDDPSTDANRAVTTNHIRDGAIVNAKIANNTVALDRLATGIGVKTNIVAFAASGTWTAPARCLGVIVTVVGGGQGGGYTSLIVNPPVTVYGQPGGCITGHFTVVPGTTFTITVGAGSAGSNTTNPAAATASSAFGLTANGGATVGGTVPNRAGSTVGSAPAGSTRQFANIWGSHLLEPPVDREGWNANQSLPAVPWSATGSLKAGQAGAPEGPGSASGGVGGAVVIQYWTLE